jgi:hypothetical protein
MSHEAERRPFAVLGISSENKNAPFCRASSEYKTVLPRRPRNAIYRRIKFFLVDDFFPVARLVASPNFYFVVVATRSDHGLVLGMCPGNLPRWPLMRLECLSVLLCTIVFYGRDLEESITITASQLGAVVVELAVVDVLLVLGVKCVYFGVILRLLLCSLTRFRVN